MKAEKKLKLEAELGRVGIEQIKHRDALAKLNQKAGEIIAELSKE